MRKSSWLPVLVATLSIFATQFANAETTLRIATELVDIPLTTGQPSDGGEGVRFLGFPLYDGLLRFAFVDPDKPAQILPALAEKWTIDASKTVWTFQLRHDVKFQDGANFTADDVVWNLDKLLNRSAPQFDQAQATQGAQFTSSIKSYRKIDDYTVEITTKYPDSGFFYRLPEIFMSSRAQWEKLGRDWGKFAQQPSGTGPWRLVKLVPRQRAEMVRNPNYWRKDGIPKIDRLVVLAMPDATTRVAALLSGQVDWIESPPPDALPRLRQAGMQIATNTNADLTYVWPYVLSYAKDSPFRDIRVRKAANLAIDRDGLVALLNGMAKPAVGMVYPSHPWFGAPTFHIRHDVDEAKRLLSQAGYGPNKHVKVRFLTSASGSGQMQPLIMNEFIQESMRDAWFDVDIEVVDFEALRAHRRADAGAPENKGISAINNGWPIIQPDLTLLGVISSDMRPPKGNNWGGFSDPKADALVAKIRNEFDIDKQNALLGQLHSYIVDQAMWIWVVYDLSPRALSPKVTNFTPALSNFQDFAPIAIN